MGQSNRNCYNSHTSVTLFRATAATAQPLCFAPATASRSAAATTTLAAQHTKAVSHARLRHPAAITHTPHLLQLQPRPIPLTQGTKPTWSCGSQQRFQLRPSLVEVAATDFLLRRSCGCESWRQLAAWLFLQLRLLHKRPPHRQHHACRHCCYSNKADTKS